MSIKIKTYNQKAEAIGERELSSKVFDLKVNEALVHQAMVAQSSNERQVLADTKNRGEVRGGGKKPWQQKGTGRARAGSSRSPIWRGGGVTFGPTSDRNFKKEINKKMKRSALCMVLSDRARNEKMFVLNEINLQNYKTKDFNNIIENFEKSFEKKDDKQKRSFLIINDISDEKVKYSGRNLANVKVLNLDNINIVDLLKYRNLLITEKSIEILEKNYGAKKK